MSKERIVKKAISVSSMTGYVLSYSAVSLFIIALVCVAILILMLSIPAVNTFFRTLLPDVPWDVLISSVN